MKVPQYKLTCLSLMIFFSCSTEQDDIQFKKSENETKLTLVNGKETDEYPWAVSIRNSEENKLCSGSFIQDDLLLTSAHCVIFGENKDRIIFNDIKSIDIYINPKYINDKPQIEHDLALVKFPVNTNPVFVEIATSHIKNLDKLEFIGYGISDLEIEQKSDGNFNSIPSENSSTNVKRIGYGVYELNNKLLDLGIIETKGVTKNIQGKIGDGERVSIGQGDSGGPLYVKNRGLVAVAYGNKIESLDSNVSYHTYLLSASSIIFFEQAKIENFIDSAYILSANQLEVNNLSDLSNDSLKTNNKKNNAKKFKKKESSCGVIQNVATTTSNQPNNANIAIITCLLLPYLLAITSLRKT